MWLVLVPLIALVGCQSIEDVGHVISGSVSGLRSPTEETDGQRQTPPSPKVENETSAAAQTISPPFSLPPNVVGETGSVSEPGDRPQANETDNQRQSPEVESAAIVAVRATPLPASPAPNDVGQTGPSSEPGDRPQDNETDNLGQTPPAPENESETTAAAPSISPPVALAPSDVGQTGSSSEPGDRPQDNETDNPRQTPPASEIESETTVAVQTAPPPSSTARTEGFVIPVSIIDGDSIRLGDRRVQLYGIDAPELDQHCQVNGQNVACGQISRQTLIDLTVGVLVQCDRLDIDRSGRDVSRCSADGLDLSSAMVRSGHAVAYRENSMDYVPDEDSAKAQKFGMWKGTFQMPWEWRADKGQNTQ
jgi:endonuclease YncB( thermonuclease family)